MVANFLSLPRELRDQIYAYALYPTGFLALKLSKSPSSGSVILQPCTRRDGAIIPTGAPINPMIVLASRQVYSETHNLLWARNEIYFANSRRLVEGMHKLGQVTSRRLARVRLMVQFEPEVRKALAKLASRARQGELMAVTLVVPGFDQSASVMNPAIRSSRYDDFLAALREMCASGTTYEKNIEVKSFYLWRGRGDQRSSGLRERHRMLGEQALYELHCAWSGRLLCNGVTVFKNYNWANGDKRSLPKLIASYRR